ncbi:PTS fructose transporter subunit IIABC [Miniphocaeibacter massiliensis]|uniref:PTS fructose transporter subunit IIABC n=1 Tax=Miniphocaeibacter massiliensis TaxID=2041841 RepID=UPI000C1BB1EE|nr:fructose-specific PTS transporter subunit EIIC [Miniphocaeibacter massiliensis]
MEIKDLLKKDLMIMNLKSSTKEEVIDEMIEKFYQENIITDKATFKSEIMNRESQSSTGLGEGVAMPHAKTSVVKTPAVLFAKSEKGLDYDSLDGEPTSLLFMIAVPEGANETHIETLAKLSKLLLHEGFIEKLKEAKTPEDVYNAIELEKKEEYNKEKIEDNSKDKPFILAVTACPTGVAHTYMAQEALEEKAKNMGVNIKVETNGSDGVKNKLTREDIDKALGVIVSVDKKVEMDRFSGKKIIETPVSEAIKNPEKLINRVLEGNLSIYKGNGSNIEKEDNIEKQSIGSKIYKDVMNGVSHMLPFVVGGGILIAFSFLFERLYGSDSEIFIFLKEAVGGTAFSFLLPILAGYIAYSIADRPALMPGMVAGYMAGNGFNIIGGVKDQAGAGFLGALVGGFIAGYVILLLKKLTKKMPESLNGLKPMLIYPVFGLLLTGLIMYVAVNPVFISVNNTVNSFLEGLGTTNKILLGIVLGGMMAVDMGGPVNKASYVFSTGVLATTQDGTFMAATMAGGMVPPIAIALATTIFRNKFTDKQRQSGITNYLLGISFITEGAIPFAAADPIRVLGSSILGAAVAGGLTQVLKLSMPAPHGGIFAATAMGLKEGGLFILCVLIGSLVAGLLYGITKKKVGQ